MTYAIRAHGHNVERVFRLAPGASAGSIHMRLAGAKRLSLKDGALVAQTGNGPVTLSRPVAYQDIEGRRRPVQVAYTVHGHDYGFQLGAYDHSHPVVVDPLVQATYLGGTGTDLPRGMTIDGGDHVYVVGSTDSVDFPGVTGGYQSSNAGGATDVFVAKLSANLKTLLHATYYGGTADDYGYSPAVASGGTVYVTGYTDSTDLPGTSGGVQGSNNGGLDAFVASFSSDLATLNAATYLGGSGDDQIEAMTLGGSTHVYVAGYTKSTDLTATGSPYQASNAGGTDAFVADLSTDLTAANALTYLGGTGEDKPYAVIVGGSGQVYVAGSTKSTDFPGTTGGAQASHGAVSTGTTGHDAFIADLAGNLQSLTQSTYLGGSGDDVGASLALASGGSVYVAGYTGSSDLAKTTGSAQPSYGGGTVDGFVSNLSADLTTLDRSTYVGRSGYDLALAVQASSGGDVYIAGYTSSQGVPGTSGGAQPTYAGGAHDGYVERLNSGLSSIVQATYLGGTGDDQPNGLRLGSSGQIYVAGQTTSTDLPGTSGGAQASYAGGSEDGFAAEYTDLATSNGYSPPSGGGSGGGGAIGLAGLLALLGLAVAALATGRRSTRG